MIKFPGPAKKKYPFLHSVALKCLKKNAEERATASKLLQIFKDKGEDTMKLIEDKIGGVERKQAIDSISIPSNPKV